MSGLGGPLALLSIWALTTVPAGFSVYILRTMFAERWPGSDAAALVESAVGTIVLWLALSAAFTAWGCAQSWRRA